MGTTKIFYSYDEMVKDMAKFFKENNDFRNLIKNEIDIMIPLSRGGLTFAQYLGYTYDFENIVSVPVKGYDNERDTGRRLVYHVAVMRNVVRDRHVLIVDDIYDSGNSIKEVINSLNTARKFTTITIFGKNGTDYYLREHDGSWIVFPWDSDVAVIKEGK